MKSLLTPAQEAYLRERSDWVGAYLVFHAWAVIALCMALFAAFPNPLTFVIALVIIGNRQLGLAILMHDAAHRALFKTTRLNDFAGSYLCGYPVGADLYLYRPYHLMHHRHTQQEGDPDLVLSAPFPITKASFKRKLIRDMLGITGYQQRKNRWHEPHFLASNIVILSLCSLAGFWWLYFALWLLPLMTWYQVVSRVRNIAEHAVVGEGSNDLRNTRTTLANPLMRLVVAPYWVNYHLEHHLFVYTPCWKLAKAHQMLVAAGYRDSMEVDSGYLAVLKKATSKRADDAAAPEASMRKIGHI